MLAHVVQAEGSPCPTLVLPAQSLPRDDAELVTALTAIRQWMLRAGAGHVLKFALVGPGADHHLDYRFVQCLPGDPVRFELRGSCGHSVLSSVFAAAERRWVPALRTKPVIRIAVRNNGDTVVCQTDASTSTSAAFTVRFERADPPSLRDMLLLGEPVCAVGGVRVSVVSAGNPYVFVDAAELGCRSVDDLFAAGDELFAVLSGIRGEAERRLGWEPGAFPKIAALAACDDGAVAVRAISVPSWHPTLALTGAVCFAAAAAIAGTIPATLAAPAAGRLVIRGPHGTTTVDSAASDGRLDWVSVSPKIVRLLDVIDVPSTRLAGRAA